MSSEVTERLRLRDEARRAALEEQRLEKEKVTVEEHTTAYFVEEFSKKRASIEEMLSSAAEAPRDQIQQHFHQIANEVQALQKYLTDSTLFLTAYEVRTSQEMIGQLQLKYLSQKDQLQPKKKFAFKSRKKIVPAGGKATPSENVDNGKSGGSEKMSTPLTSAVDVRDKTGEDIELKDDAVRGQDVALCNLSNCVVRICGVPGTVHCSNVRECRFQFGPVYRSVFVDDCSNCNFTVACQQLRVHRTHSSVFNLHITSHPIIEDSTGLQFSTYNWQYLGFEAHFTDAGLSHEVNSWNKIDDFNWLSSKEPSPNWSLLSDIQQS